MRFLKYAGLTVAIIAVTIGTLVVDCDLASQAAVSAGISHQTATPTIVAIAQDPTLSYGYWEVASNGTVTVSGGAIWYGDASGYHLNKPIVGIAASPDGLGYWLVAADGGVFAFGSASFFGSMGGTTLAGPIVAIAPTVDGNGYWLLGSDGGVFSFGTATYLGRVYFEDAVGIVNFGYSGGYTIATSNGQTDTYVPGMLPVGTAPITPLNAPIVGITYDNDSKTGFWLVAADGGIFSSEAPFYGSATATPHIGPFVGIASAFNGSSYVAVDSSGGITIREGDPSS
jgi:hypothetical protein